MREDRDKILTTGSIVKYFKRGLENELTDYLLFRIIGVAIDTKSGKRMVIYQALRNSDMLYARDIDEFCNKVDKERYPDSKQEYIFELV